VPAPQLIAHRGVPRELPENTLPGFARALELGADGIELDVHATADGVVVVHHDPTPRATTEDAALAGRPIATLTHREVQRFRVGGVAEIPTLTAVLDLVGTRATVYVEIKGQDIEREVLRVLEQSAAPCAVHSFDHLAVRRVRELRASIPTGALVTRRPADAGALLRELGARDLWPEWPIIDEALVRQVHDAGGRVIAWTVNDSRQAARLAAIGVDGVCTDFVSNVGSTLRSRTG
jgi:glycerophosphoryl diester phosphodiesterase